MVLLAIEESDEIENHNCTFARNTNPRVLRDVPTSGLLLLR